MIDHMRGSEKHREVFWKSKSMIPHERGNIGNSKKQISAQKQKNQLQLSKPTGIYLYESLSLEIHGSQLDRCDESSQSELDDLEFEASELNIDESLMQIQKKREMSIISEELAY